MTPRAAALLLSTSLVLVAACSMHSREAGMLEDPVEVNEIAMPEAEPTSTPVGGEGDSSASLDDRTRVADLPARTTTETAELRRQEPVEESSDEVASGRLAQAEKKAEAPMVASRKDPSSADMDALAVSTPTARPARERGVGASTVAPASPKTTSGGSAGYGAAMGPTGGAVAASTGSVAMPAEPVQPQQITTYGGTEDYTDYGVNPYTMVVDDALSTFSIDVDTASYAIARKKIEAGALPPLEGVRVEEFINYLDYGYTGPSQASEAPFAVHMAAMPDPFRDNRHILRVGVQAKEVSRDEREPVHLTFLVDVSGSMSSPDKLPLAQQSMHMLVDSLREDDTVALATYAGRVARILEPTSAGNKRAIHDAISSLQSGGSTGMSSGIDLAYEMAWESFEKGHENRVIVLSDGDANVGRTSWDEMLSQIKGYADRGVTLSTIGLGMGNYKDTLMEQLSNKGDGNNFYIDDADQARRVFVEDLGGTMVTVARDVKIQVEFNEESVLAYRLLGYENRDIADKDFRNDKVDAGEVGSGHNVTALYEVILAEGYDRELATVRLRWEQPGADVDQGGSGGRERAYTFRDRDLAETVSMAPRTLRMAYATATFAEILRHSPAAQELSMDELIAFAKASKRPGEDDDAEVVALMEKARALGLRTSGGTVTRR